MNQNSLQSQTMEIPFPTDSPINSKQLGGQNKKVYDHLMSGKTINCIEAQNMGITALNSRISDLRNKHDIEIMDRFVNIGTGKSIVKQYWITL
jgi:hypothetical protein